MAKTKVPRLRFSGFSGEWKEDSLGNYSHIIGGGTPSTSNDKYWNGTINWFSPIEIGENKYVSNSAKKISDIGLKKSSAKILPKGSLLFTSRAGIGKTAILLKESCTNQGFQSIVPADGKLDIEFLYAISYKLKNYGNKMGSGSTFIEVSGKTMSKMKLKLPNFNEQQKIGDFFAKQDKLIELQTQKVDELKKLKRGYLQKMFPQEGETVPRLRFSGFSGKWKEVKLGDVVNYEQPTRYIVNSTEYDNDYKTPVLTAGKSFILGYTNEENIKVASRESSVIVFDDFTANNHYVDFNFMVKSSAIKILDAKEGNLTYFINCVLNNITYVPMSHNRQWISRYSKFIINIPLFKEQEKIVSLFQKIDKLIEEQSNKLDQLKQQKKAYLQKMFI